MNQKYFFTIIFGEIFEIYEILFKKLKINKSRVELSYLKNLLKDTQTIMTFEENTLTGGFGSMILEFCNEHLKHKKINIQRYGFEDVFPTNYGNQSMHLEKHGMSPKLIYKKIMKLFN